MNQTLGSMPSDLKEQNRRAVLQTFRDGSTLTANEVSALTGISRQTVKRSITFFQQKGYLHSLGKGSSSQSGGKPAELFKLDPRSRLICIAVHHQDIDMFAMGLDSKLIASWNSGKIHLENLDALWAQVRRGMAALLDGKAVEDVVSAGLSVPFASDRDNNLTVATPFPHWPSSDFGRSLEQPIREMFPKARDVLVISDGYAAGLAARLENPGLGFGQTLATFYTSYGIGGSVVGGKADRSVKGIVGAFGHITVDTSEKALCSCGGRGCLEQMVNRSKLVQRIKERCHSFQQSCLKGLSPNQVTFQDIFAGSARGDHFCQEESRYYARMFSVALRNIYLTTGPDLVVMQGDFGKADQVFQEELVGQLRRFQYITDEIPVKIIYDQEDLGKRECAGLTCLLVDAYLGNPGIYKDDQPV